MGEAPDFKRLPLLKSLQVVCKAAEDVHNISTKMSKVNVTLGWQEYFL